MKDKIEFETRAEYWRKRIEQMFSEYSKFPDEENYNKLSKLLIGHYVKGGKAIYYPRNTFIHKWTIRKGLPEDEIKDFCWNILTDIISWLKGDFEFLITQSYGKEEILKPYRLCKKEGEAFGNFERYLFYRIETVKARIKFQNIESSFSREVKKEKLGETDELDSDAPIYLEDKITYGGMFDLKHNLKGEVKTFRGQKISLNNTPLEMYVGKETREEIFVKVSSDIQEEAWRQTMIEANIKSIILYKRYPEIWTWLRTVSEDNPIWEVFALVDEDRFIILCDKLASQGFFPKEKDVVVMFQAKQLDSLLQASKSHDKIRTEKKIKKEEDEKEKTYEYITGIPMEESNPLQFKDQRIVESSGRWSINRMTNILRGLGIKIKRETLKKRLDDFRKAKGLLHKIDLKQRGLTKMERIEERWLNSLFYATLFTKLKEKALGLQKLKREAVISKLELIDIEKEVKIDRKKLGLFEDREEKNNEKWRKKRSDLDQKIRKNDFKKKGIGRENKFKIKLIGKEK